MIFAFTLSDSMLVSLPLLVPILAGAGALALWFNPRLQEVVSLLGMIGLVAVSVALFLNVESSGIVTSQSGGWSAPYGITLIADLLSAVMVVLSSIIGLAVIIFSLSSHETHGEKLERQYGFHPLVHILLLGVNGAFLTGDLFNLYVWFEVLLISSFVLLSLGSSRHQLEGGLKYVTVNLISSAIFLAATGILYGMVGSLNMAEVAIRLGSAPPPPAITAVAGLFLVAFGIKAAVFPLFFWLPASYHTPPLPVAALFAGLLTKVGVYALIRVFTLVFSHNPEITHDLLLIIAGLTMIVGVFGAMIQNNFRRVLSFHIISQIGYMIMGLALFAPLALAGSVFYIIHHIIVKTNLFLIAGLVQQRFGTTNLKKIGGLYRSAPWVSILFIIPAFSLAGIPPLSGFFPKFILVKAGLEQGAFVIVGIALFVSVCTLFSMIKLWSEAFLKDPPQAPACPGRFPPSMILAVCLLTTITLWISFDAARVFELSERVAGQLMNPTEYIEAVFPKISPPMELGL